MARVKLQNGVEVPFSSNEEAEWNAEVAAWDAGKTTRDIAEIKKHTHEIILQRMPDWKQRNLIARTIELKEKASPTPEELAEIAAAQVEWDWVKATRAHSDTLEQQASQGTLPADWRDTGWPT